MTAVHELLPGQKVQVEPGIEGLANAATFVAATDHPLYLGLALVIWRMPKGSPVGDWSHDALSWKQHVGDVVEGVDRIVSLRQALHGGRG